MRRTTASASLLALGLLAGCGSGAASPASSPASHAASPRAGGVSCQRIDHGAGKLLAKAQNVTGTSMQADLKREVYKEEVQALLKANVQRGCPADPQLAQAVKELP
jgi:hypothetical protein